MKHLKEACNYSRMLQESYINILLESNKTLKELTQRPIEDLRFAYRIYRDLVRVLEHAISKEDRRDAYLIMTTKLNRLESQILDRIVSLNGQNITQTSDGYKINVKSTYKNQEYNVVFNLITYDEEKGKGGFNTDTEEFDIDILDDDKNLTLYELSNFFRCPETTIHEVTHYIDWLRNNKKIPPLDQTIQLGSPSYYNDPDELNAFTQQLLLNIRYWFIYDANPQERLEVLQNPDKAQLLLNHLCSVLTTHQGRATELDRLSLYNFWWNLTDENKKEVAKQVSKYITDALKKINIKKQESVEIITIFDFFEDI